MIFFELISYKFSLSNWQVIVFLVQAINYYSRANTIKPGNAVILSNRCGAYLRLNVVS